MKYDELPPGAILSSSEKPVIVNAGLSQSSVRITNTREISIHLTAHLHVFEANPGLRFDRRKAFGMRPDVPAGSAVRIGPGESVDVPLVPIGGNRVVRGFWGLIDGPIDRADIEVVLARAIELGFLHEPEG